MNNKQDSILKVDTPEYYWEKCEVDVGPIERRHLYELN
jgi:hypothetical protein